MFLPFEWVLTKPPELAQLLAAFAGKPSEAVVANLTAAVQVVIRSSAEEEEEEGEEEEGEEGPGEERTGEESTGEESTSEAGGGAGSGGAGSSGAGSGGAGAGGAPGDRTWTRLNWQCFQLGLNGAACGDLVARLSTDFFGARECDLYPCFADGAACG